MITIKEANRKYLNVLGSFVLFQDVHKECWKKLCMLREGGFTICGQAPTQALEAHAETLDEAVDIYNTFSISEEKDSEQN